MVGCFLYKNIKNKITFIIIVSLFIVSVTSPKSVYAAWYDNAVDFYKRHKGDKIAEYYSGTETWYYGQRGAINSNSTIYYRTIGFRIRVVNNGITYHCGVSRTDGVDDKLDKDDGGYRYSLWGVSFETLVSRLKDENPNVDFSFLYDRNKDTYIYFDARVTYINNGVIQGGVDKYGNPSWGTVWDNPKDNNQWNMYYNGNLVYTVPQDERDDLFNIPAELLGTSKPSPIPVNGTANVHDYEYKVPNQEVYWVQQNNPFKVYAESYINKSYGVFPTENRIDLYHAANKDSNRVHLYDNNTNTTSGNFYNYLTDVAKQATSKPSSDTANYLCSIVQVTAKRDGDAFELWNTSLYKNSQAPQYKYSGKVIKVDGVAPNVTFSPDGSGWTRSDILVNLSATDYGSGLAYTNVWVQRNNSGWVYQGTNVPSVYLSQSGHYDVIVEAIDRVGNSSGYIVRSFYIDKEPPVITFNPDGMNWTRQNVTVYMSIYDALSGLHSYTVNHRVDGGAWSTPNTNLTRNLTTEGVYDIQVSGQDNVGNTSTVTRTFMIDKTPPTSTSTDVRNKTLDTFDIFINNVTDTRSGVSKVEVITWVDNGNGKLYEQTIAATKVNGTNNYKAVVNRNNFNGNSINYYYKIKLTDNVGNYSMSSVYGPNEMLQYNLTAENIGIYDYRANRYVTQLIEGYEYEAVIQYKNTGEVNIPKNSNYTVALLIDNKYIKEVTVNVILFGVYHFKH